MRRSRSQRSLGWTRWAVLAGALLASSCGPSDSKPEVGVAAGVATPVSPVVSVPSAPPRTAPRAVLTVSAPLAGSGVGLIDRTEVRLLTVGGETVAVGEAPGFYVNDVARPVEVRVEGKSVALQTSSTAPEWAGEPFAKACVGPRSAQQDRVVAICGDDPRQPDRIDVADGRGVRTLIHSPTKGTSARAVGHWRAASLSPDGRTVLAQWSGECEVPTAYFIDFTTSATTSVTGEREGSASRPNSIALTWTDERTALVVLPGGACGSGTEPAGLYSVSPGRPPRLIHAAGGEFPSGFVWRQAT